MSRFPAPAASCSEHPLFAGIAAWRIPESFGGLQALNDLLPRAGASSLRFAAQTPELLADGLHYEERIATRGIIATREGNPHDVFNAQIWLAHTGIKRAMNARQMSDIARVGRKQRTRGQCALTHFDEAGAIVWAADDELMPCWNAHDWPGLFLRHRQAWGTGIAVTLIGHALLEYALDHATLPVAKALVVKVDRDDIAARRGIGATIASWAQAERHIAADIESGCVLADPQELRPLPLAGIPGWHCEEQSAEFYASAPCFRPLRPGRRYPSPLVLRAMDDEVADVKTAAAATLR